MKFPYPFLFFLLTAVWIHSPVSPVQAQQLPGEPRYRLTDPVQRMLDSLAASQIPVLNVSPDALKQSLPDSLDNSSYLWFPGILDQDGYFSCQQYSGTAYTFAYEMNRSRNVDGTLPENKYPPHYMWHFFNQGQQYVGTNFLHSFHAMMDQGHMTNADFGPDLEQRETGWITGYEKYYRAMKNRIRGVYAIPINSAQGIQTVKQYLFDHLDGSSTGGIACFTASSPGGSYGPFLPPYTPEAGKYVITEWQPYPTHGMTIVGYHDSIRFDLNEDGQYTNDIDITGDGIVDARDWEFGGFRLANSYGSSWADHGYFYVLYHAMASNFEEGGVWNNCVYVVETDPDYSPLLTVKIDLDHTMRDQLNIMAGVSRDLQSEYPDQILTFPIFSNQGGPMFMQGFDTLPEQKNLEFGLDATPLLSLLDPGEPAKFFLIIEEHDPADNGEGIVHEASFLHYGTPLAVFPCSASELPVRNNGTTILPATGTVNPGVPVIQTEELPPVSPSGTCSVQLQAHGGEAPYSWMLHQPYEQTAGNSPYVSFTDERLYPHSSGSPFATVALPFGFPFFGTSCDTVFVNAYGMIHFSPENLPYPYLCSVSDMFDYIAAIAPCFSWDWVIRNADGDGMWMSSTPDSVRFRWKLSLTGFEAETNVEFGATLFPDGKISFSFGPVQLEPESLPSWSGISSGDKYNTLVVPLFDLNAVTGSSRTWLPPSTPGNVSLTPGGLLTVSAADTNLIYNVPVRVTDRQRLSAEKHLQLSSGLLIRHELASPSGHLQQGEPAAIDLRITNITANPFGEVTLQLFCDEPGLDITDSLAMVASLDAGMSTGIEDAFSCTLQPDLPDQTPLPCRIVASSGGKSWEYRFFLTVSTVNLQVTTMEIQDGVNGLLDAGETANLVFTLSNLGSLPAQDLVVTLSTADEFLEILSSPSLSVGTIGRKTMQDLFFTVKASRNTLPGHQAEMELSIANGMGIDIIHPCSLTLGTQPVALISLTTNTTSVPLMESLMDSLHVGYDLFTSMPETMNKYPAVFIILGTGFPGSVALSTEQTNLLIHYLTEGGNAYVESYASWYYGTGKILQDIFMYSTERVSVYYFYEMEGVDGTFTEGMEYPYEGSSPYAIFEVTPKGEAYSLMNSKEGAQCLEFAYPGEQYRTIGTFKEFGQLADSEPPSQKAILFRYYLEFLGVNIDGPFPFFHADTTHFCQWHTVQFMDDSFDDITTWHWEFPGGDPATSVEQNPLVKYHSPGTFDVILTVSDGVHSQSMHKKKYIHVNVCAGVDEALTREEGLRLFPNPAGDNVYISFPETLTGQVRIELINLRGAIVNRRVSRLPAGHSLHSIDVSMLPPGIYLVRVTGDKAIHTKKLVIY